MRQPITKGIQQAVAKLLSEKNWTLKKLGDLIGVSQEAITQWQNGDTKSISSKVWLRLFPLIEPYIQDGKTLLTRERPEPAKQLTGSEACNEIDEYIASIPSEAKRALAHDLYLKAMIEIKKTIKKIEDI